MTTTIVAPTIDDALFKIVDTICEPSSSTGEYDVVNSTRYLSLTWNGFEAKAIEVMAALVVAHPELGLNLTVQFWTKEMQAETDSEEKEGGEG